MSLIEIPVPDIGDFDEVEVIEVLVQPGDTIKAEQSLVTVESDKASMEIPSPANGVVGELRVKLGDKVKKGSVLLMLEAAAQDAAKDEAPAAESKAASTAASPAPAMAPAASSPTPAAPAATNTPAAPAAASTPAAPVAAAAAPAAKVRSDVAVPDIGDFESVEVIEILVKPGDRVALDQSLITVESDKASMEIPAPASGVIVEMRVKVGDKVAQGSVIAVVDGDAPAGAAAVTAASDAPAAAAAEAPRAASTQTGAPSPAEPTPVATATPADAASTEAAPVEPGPSGSVPHASPSVRKFARELGVDLARVSGSGPKNRILHTDVQAYVKQAVASTVSGQTKGAAGQAGAGGGLNLLPWPSLDFSKFGPTELSSLSRIKRISGPNLARNWAMIPHVTQFDEADVTTLEDFRKESNLALGKSGVKLTMLAFVIRACVATLKEFPNFNASLDAKGENLILKQYWNIGFAADTPNGLVVPVIKNADTKGVKQIAAELGELSALAREGKLKPGDMQGASFTVSSLGGIGGTAFTPIINAPEVAILGLSRTQMKPVWDGKEFVPRLMLPLSLSYDHRVIDGAQGARFTTWLADVLADMRKVLL